MIWTTLWETISQREVSTLWHFSDILSSSIYVQKLGRILYTIYTVYIILYTTNYSHKNELCQSDTMSIKIKHCGINFQSLLQTTFQMIPFYQMMTHLTPCPRCSPITTCTTSLYLSNPESVEDERWAVIVYITNCAGTIQGCVVMCYIYINILLEGLVLMRDILLYICNDKHIQFLHSVHIVLVCFSKGFSLVLYCQPHHSKAAVCFLSGRTSFVRCLDNQEDSECKKPSMQHFQVI